MDEERDGLLAEPARQWIQDEADRHFGGNFGRAAAAILEAAYAAECDPGALWAGLEARVRLRQGR